MQVKTPKSSSLSEQILTILIVSGIISLVIVAVNSGMSLNLIDKWPRTWLLAFVVGTPTNIAVKALIHKIK